jgi:RNA-binding protein
MPTGDLRRRLRSAVHALDPIVHVGKESVTPALLRQLEQALSDHELVKVKIGSECPDTRFEVAERLAAEPGVNVVQIIGRVVAVYKRHPHKPRYEGPAAPAPRPR